MRGKPGDLKQSYITLGYRAVLCPGHPRTIDPHGNYVLEHVLIAEMALGRALDKKHPVHHFNEVKADNAHGNLVICESIDYHHLLHARQRIANAGGDPNKDKICRTCKMVRARGDFQLDGTRGDGLSPRCRPCTKTSDADRHRRNYVPTGHRPRKAACARGHVYTELSTYVSKFGVRQCRECTNSRLLAKRNQALIQGAIRG